MAKALFCDIQSTLIHEINHANERIIVAVAWFTNRYLFDGLLKRAKAGVEIQVLILNDSINSGVTRLPWQLLVDVRGVSFYFAEADRGLMHHKFCIVDHKHIFTGSYNWTYAAEHSNQENVFWSDDTDAVTAYKREFTRQTGNLKKVLDIQAYLNQHPPREHMGASSSLVIEEAIQQVSYAPLNMQQRLERLQQALSTAPASIELLTAQIAYQKMYFDSLETFCIQHPEVFAAQLGERYTWKPELLRLYIKKVYSGHFQRNTATNWEYRMIGAFQACLFESTSNLGSQFPGNQSIFVSRNQLREFYSLDNRYKELKSIYPTYNDESRDPDEPFHVFREIFSHKARLSPHVPAIQYQYEDEEYPWTEEELLTSLKDIRFSFAKASKKIVWTKEMLLAVRDKMPWQYHLFCSNIYLTPQQLAEFAPIINWQGIAANERLDWSPALFNQYKQQLLGYPKEFCKNEGFPWTAEFINTYEQHLSFESLSQNHRVPFTTELVLMYKNRWHYHSGNYGSISFNKAVPWNEELMDELRSLLNWTSMAENTAVPWTLELIDKYQPESAYEADFYWNGLKHNRSVWENVFKPFINDTFLFRMAAKLPDIKV